MADYQLTHPGPTVQQALDIALGVEQQISQEAAAREAADALLATKTELAAETSRAQAAEALLATIAMLDAEIARATGVEGTLQSLIAAINEKIPSAASSSNQLADKAFVNSSIGTASATYISNNGEPFTSVAQLNAYTGPHDKNDYAFVVSTDAAGNTVYSRYKYDGSAWAKEYDLNNSSFTAAQWAAINSAVTAELVAKLSALPDNATLTAALAAKQDVIEDLSSIRSKANSAYQKPSGGIPKTDLASGVQTSLGKADSAIQDVSDKADKDTDAVEGNVAQFDASGNPVDGGVPVENIAQKDGYYGGMTVGAAENLVGRGVVEAEYVDRRTSAGSADIGSGSASIRKIWGRSVKWNQLVRNGDFSDGTTGWIGVASITDGVARGYKAATGSAIYQDITTSTPITYVIGHKYLFLVDCLSNNSDTGLSIRVSSTTSDGQTGSYVRTQWTTVSYFWTAGIAAGGPRVRGYNGTDASLDVDFSIKNFRLFDLTDIFGAGNEPATVAAFEEWLAQNVGLRAYYPYDAGSILNNAADGIKTRGFNLYNPATGKAYLPGKYSDYPHEYEICGTFSSISYTDINGNTYVPELTDGKFFNVSAPGELTVVGGNSTDTLVHLVWSGWRNEGEPDYAYEAYWENTLALNLTTLTGKLNGEGESVVIAPNGLAKVGSVEDYGIVENGMLTKIVKCVGVVDMGTLTWNYTQESFRSSGVSSTIKTVVTSAVPNIVNVRYEASKRDAQPDKCIGVTTAGNLVVNDFSYSAAADFKTSVTGVLLYYELATPRVYVLDEPIAMNYRVDDFGTEETIPAYDSQRLIAPLAYDVQYAMNAVDVIRRLPDNYVERADVKQTPGTSETHILSQKCVEDNYAHKVGTEDNLTVGAAKNIVGNATSGGYPFTFVRISGTDGLAKINNVKGDSVVWNQLVTLNPGTYTASPFTVTIGANNKVTISGTAEGNVNAGIPNVISQVGQFVSGHKYLFFNSNGAIAPGAAPVLTFYFGSGVYSPALRVGKGIYTYSGENKAPVSLNVSSGAGTFNTSFYFQVIDLTLMFGAGNEPATVEEFEALYPLPYYDYNAGTILSNKTEQVKVVGFNQWDEEWELGTINVTTGENEANNSRIRSKNYIPILPNTQYYLKWGNLVSSGRFVYYDKNKNFVSGSSDFLPNTIFTTPANAFYCKHSPNTGYGTTYQNNICINLSDPSRNGTYEPYKTNTIEFNLPTLTGKLNGEGESVTICPEGLKSAGSFYDEGIIENGYLTKIIKRVGVVDMGTLNWSGTSRHQATIAGMANTFVNGAENYALRRDGILCKAYSIALSASTSESEMVEDTIIRSSNNVFIKDSTYGQSEFQGAVSGVMLYYVLATPVTYILDTPLPATFQSYKGGTLQQLPENTATPVTAPCAFSVTYAIDAAGILTGLPQNYVSKESMQAFLTALGTAMSGTWTMTWDDTTGRYTFTFTPNE